MTPFSHAQTEMLLAVQRAEGRAAVYLAATPKDAAGNGIHNPLSLHDHRVAVAGDVADALDFLQQGLGERFMAALYPELDLRGDPDWQALMGELQRPRMIGGTS